eukprot:gene307-33556_t
MRAPCPEGAIVPCTGGCPRTPQICMELSRPSPSPGPIKLGTSAAPWHSSISATFSFSATSSSQPLPAFQPLPAPSYFQLPATASLPFSISATSSFSATSSLPFSFSATSSSQLLPASSHFQPSLQLLSHFQLPATSSFQPLPASASQQLPACVRHLQWPS